MGAAGGFKAGGWRCLAGGPPHYLGGRGVEVGRQPGENGFVRGRTSGTDMMSHH